VNREVLSTLIDENRGLTTEPRTAGAVARASGIADTRSGRRQVAAALTGREGVGRKQETKNGKDAWFYYRLSVADDGTGQTGHP
jgi:hypothetical protein